MATRRNTPVNEETSKTATGTVVRAHPHLGATLKHALAHGLSRNAASANGEATGETSAVELVDEILDSAIEARATDIHMDPQDGHVRIRYRIDGMLHDAKQLPAEISREVITRLKVIAGMEVTEHRHPQDGHFTREWQGKEIDFRVASSPVILGEKVVVRILRDERVASGISQLGMNEGEIQLVRQLVARPYGMILATGPVGSGKTTTLYSLLHEVDIRCRNVMTIEDPVEYRLRGINQMQVDVHAGFGFIEGLRAILRQDPNIIMIGEIRDEETATAAVKAAMTGVLVLSTLHANDAPGTVGSLMELGVPRFAIASALIGVIAQRLVRKICAHCGEEYRPPESLLETLGLRDALQGQRLRRGKGCEHCFRTGYFGRTGVFEILPVTAAVQDAIVRGERLAGAGRLSQSALAAVRAGVTTLEEYSRVVFT